MYERYKSDGIVVGENISFMNLISTIAAELGIDESKKNIDIRYVVEGNSSPLCIQNDMGVKLYVEIKNHEAGFGTYPLCIDTSDKGVEDIINFDATTGVIMCIEGEKSDAKALNIVEYQLMMHITYRIWMLISIYQTPIIQLWKRIKCIRISQL